MHTITANYAGVERTFLRQQHYHHADGHERLGDDRRTADPAGSRGGWSSRFRPHHSHWTVHGVVAAPTGSLNYNVLNSSNVSVASGTAPLTPGETDSAATVPILNSLAPGSYTVSVTYAGDGNYAASSSATTIQVVVGLITPTINWTQPARRLLMARRSAAF